jgi:phospholipase C
MVVHRNRGLLLSVFATLVSCSDSHRATPPAVQGLSKVNHIVVVMMENHSFDNYFGALPYVPGGPYHRSSSGCMPDDHSCVDGLNCLSSSTGNLTCANENPEDAGSPAMAFHNPSRCVIPDLAHVWRDSHLEANFEDPNATLTDAPNDGFVRVNDSVYQPDRSIETGNEDPTMGFYTQVDLPFYYHLAQKFAIDDRYFASVIGPTLPNRFYLLAATSFGHVSSGDGNYLPPDGLKPRTGTILDLLDSRGISWTDYYDYTPQVSAFRQPTDSTDPHFRSIEDFLTIAAGTPAAASLPEVSFLDTVDAEHPPEDIQRGQAFVSRVVNAIRSGPYWRDSVIFITYDEHGGFYDHVSPPRAPQGGASTPDGISPGQCADLSHPPASEQPGAGAGCNESVGDAESLCPALAQNPGGPYPNACATFDQLGFRVPFIAVSPFAKAHYVSHTVADHASILAFIEQRFLNDQASGGAGRLHLTLRDQYASPLEDLFDFENAPSLQTPLIESQLPVVDCTPPGF